MTIDITALSRVIRRLDVSATLKAFVAVLAPLFVLNNLASIIAMIKVISTDGFSFVDGMPLVLMLLGHAILAFAPLAFIVADWVARRDASRHLSAIAGAAWGAFGFLIVGGLLGLIV